ncbi:MAG: YedE family putative selenium transporter, partial [Clostridiales bacterium]|nr:YedE family putative selenium transporter [Clostridiales bacterium]
MAEKFKLPLAGALAAIVSLILVLRGNPANMGFCVACFLRDTAGALGLHGVSAPSYARPEIMGLVLGAAICSAATKEFAPKGGSAPLTRFVLGVCVMIGALIFLGCPLRMALRIAGGDLNAVVGLLGFAAGILLGVFFLNRGFSLKRAYSVSGTDGAALPFLCLLLLAVLLLAPYVLVFSEQGPGAAHAPLLISLAAGLIMGVTGYLSRLCFAGGIRDMFLFKSFSMLSAFVAIIAVGIGGNIFLGSFNVGFAGQPIAHTDGLWNFLGLALVGFGSVLLGGCPFRQLILAGSGNSDSAVTVLGMILGAALAHNLDMASSAAGVTTNGKAGFFTAAFITLFIA